MRRGPVLLLATPLLVAVLVAAATVLEHTREVTGEFAAEARIRTIHAAESEFHNQFGRYAASLQELGLAPVTEGYSFSLKPTSGGYAIQAAPQVYGVTGRRTFYSDQKLTIRQNWSSVPAGADSLELK